VSSLLERSAPRAHCLINLSFRRSSSFPSFVFPSTAMPDRSASNRPSPQPAAPALPIFDSSLADPVDCFRSAFTRLVAVKDALARSSPNSIDPETVLDFFNLIVSIEPSSSFIPIRY
jgi:hypothetical protein